MPNASIIPQQVRLPQDQYLQSDSWYKIPKIMRDDQL